MTARPSRRGPRKQLIRERDGTLYDLTEDRPIAASELQEYLAGGGYFEARRGDGAECTAQVLHSALLAVAGDTALLGSVAPGRGAFDSLGDLVQLAEELASRWAGNRAAPGRRPPLEPSARRKPPRAPGLLAGGPAEGDQGED